MEKPTNKKIFSWVSFVLSTVIFALAFVVFLMSVTARSRNDRVEIFGFSLAVVATDSMAPEIKVGDLIIVKRCDIADIQVGQNAVFMGLSGTYEGKSIVHRVVGIYDVFDDLGKKTGICLETWGISNPDIDDDYVYSDNFIGREIYHSSALGGIMTFLRNPLNLLYLLVLVIVSYVAVKQGRLIVKLIKNQGQEVVELGSLEDIIKFNK